MSKLNKRKQKAEFNVYELPKIALSFCVSAYMVVLFGLYPLYYQQGYTNMGEAKAFMIKKISIYIIPIAVVLFLVYLVFNLNNIDWRHLYKKITYVDFFVLGYFVAVTISYLLTPYKDTALWGYPGWYMGWMSQLLFVLLYFFVSRFFKWNGDLFYILLGTSCIVFLLGILNRFQIDPLEMYTGVEMGNRVMFLSTIGQATWYSSYVCVVFPIGLFFFWQCRRKIKKILLGIYVFLGFATLVTQNSDSAYIAIALFLLVLFLFSFDDNEKLIHFLGVIVLALFAFKMMGLLQILFPDAAIKLESLSTFCSQSVVTLILLLLAAGIYVLLIWMDKREKLDAQRWKILPKLVIIFAGVGVVAVLGVVWLTTTKNMPDFLSFLYKIEYFNFDTNWGNGRGFTWQWCGRIFSEYPVINKIFGCGPDCFADYGYAYYASELSSKWGNNVLTNAHNEWFTSLLYFGIAGCLTYIGIFISEIAACFKSALEKPFLIAIIMVIVSYMGHNLFCYQQLVCTPFVFIFIGMGERIRSKED